MMLQFEVIVFQGERWLFEVQTERYDFWIGFLKTIKKLC